MARLTIFLICVLSVVNSKTQFIITVVDDNNLFDDPGIPLILTPLLEQNKTDVALSAAQNHFNGFKNILSYSGYFTVNKEFNSNLFFWFFPTPVDYKNAPLIVWIQGAFRVSSLIGLLTESGPYKANSRHGLDQRQYTWLNAGSLLYIDSPVGSGYSFTTNGYAPNQTQIANELYNMLEQFFTLFPALESNDLYIFGESYGGKSVISLSRTIHERNSNSPQTVMNLKGLAICNGFVDPINQIQYSEYLYQIGLIDINEKSVFEQYEQQITSDIQSGNFGGAFQVFNNLINGNLDNIPTLFKNITDFSNVYNLLNPIEINNQLQYALRYIQRDDVRAAIHVGNATLNIDNEVENNLENDIMQGVTTLLPDLLDNYRVLIYNGQLNVIFPYSSIINYLQKLQYNGSDQYKNAKRQLWTVSENVAGYVKIGGNLTEILVRNAGHMVCADQQEWCLDMVLRFTRNKSFF